MGNCLSALEPGPHYKLSIHLHYSAPYIFLCPNIVLVAYKFKKLNSEITHAKTKGTAIHHSLAHSQLAYRDPISTSELATGMRHLYTGMD